MCFPANQQHAGYHQQSADQLGGKDFLSQHKMSLQNGGNRPDTGNNGHIIRPDSFYTGRDHKRRNDGGNNRQQEAIHPVFPNKLNGYGKLMTEGKMNKNTGC